MDIEFVNNFYLEYHKNIQGNFWKINISLYTILIDLLNKLIYKRIHLEYDTQSLFCYYIYIILNGELNKNNINIIGNNFKESTINGLSIWCERDKAAHANMAGLNNLYIEDKKLKSTYHNEKEIHIISFTFDSLLIIRNNTVFQKIFN